MNLTDLQSAIGLRNWIELMRCILAEKSYGLYNSNLKDLRENCQLCHPQHLHIHALHLYTIGLPFNVDRDQFVWECKQRYGVTMGIHYNSINTFTVYKKMNLFDDPTISYPEAFAWGKRTISLSLSAAVSDDNAERVVNCVKSILYNLS